MAFFGDRQGSDEEAVLTGVEQNTIKTLRNPPNSNVTHCCATLCWQVRAFDEVGCENPIEAIGGFEPILFLHHPQWFVYQSATQPTCNYNVTFLKEIDTRGQGEGVGYPRELTTEQPTKFCLQL